MLQSNTIIITHCQSNLKYPLKQLFMICNGVKSEVGQDLPSSPRTPYQTRQGPVAVPGEWRRICSSSRTSSGIEGPLHPLWDSSKRGQSASTLHSPVLSIFFFLRRHFFVRDVVEAFFEESGKPTFTWFAYLYGPRAPVGRNNKQVKDSWVIWSKWYFCRIIWINYMIFN